MRTDPEFFECKLLPVPTELAWLATAEVSGCETCSISAQIPFDWILADVMDPPGKFEFVLQEPARCPLCREEITEKTLVDVSFLPAQGISAWRLIGCRSTLSSYSHSELWDFMHSRNLAQAAN